MSHWGISRFCLLLFGMLMGASVEAQSVAPGQGLPTGGTVVSGQVTTSKTNNTLTIDQTSHTAILNWQSFSIGSGNTVKVIQPSSTSALLDRVTGNTPSVIAGQLDANGEVLLINPNGIAITQSGVIDVGGGFVASTLAVSDEDFKDGKLNFTGTGASAGVSNAGTITVGRGGYAALLGGTVKNSGLISVPVGKVGLGSGEAATLDVSGDGFLQVAVPTRVAGQAALIQSSGTIEAQGGNVIMSAATARAAARNAINLSGLVQANSISGHEGSITLSGGAGGQVSVSGTLDTSGKAGAQDSPLYAPAPSSGGSISITGENITLSGASLDASGASGGTIRIGGDEHGSGPLLQADTVSVDASTIIKADALGTSSTRTAASGNGGSVVLWSTEQTNFLGKISATGALGGGNGGQAEVSSHNLLTYAGSTNLSAPHGSFGDLLLDPYNITIETASGETNGTLGGGSFTPSGSNSILSVADLQSALGTANVTVATGGAGSQGSDAGNITVANALTWSSGSTLTLNAYNSIAVNAGISLAGGGLSLTTTSTTNGALTVNAPITVSGAGSVTISVPNLTYTSGSGSVSTPNMAFTNGGSLQFTGSSGGVAQGSLNINSHAYTLLNSLAQVDGIDSSAAGSGTGYTATHLGSGLSGYYALATDVTAPTGVSYTAALVGSGSSAFTGVFEGLGNTISNLSINSSSGGDVALFAYLNGSAAAVRDLGLIGGGTIKNTSTSPATGSLIAYNYNGLVFQDYSTIAVQSTQTDSVGGLVGTSSGFVVNSYATGGVSGKGTVGGLVGHNSLNGGYIYGEILDSYATGNVTDESGAQNVGGLVGGNEIPVSNSYATGAVSAAGASNVGGLVGYENYDGSTHVSASINNSYATGAVYGGTDVGGLVGVNAQGATITNAYSTGAVAGTTNVGGFLGSNSGTVTNGYWDNLSSGITSTGIASGTNSGATGISTTNLQSSANPSNVTLGSAFGGGAMAANGGTTGVYPYLIALDPNGVQAISGFAYTNAAGTALASGSAGAGQVSVLIGSTAAGTASTGANGYYYLAVPAGTISTSGSPVVAYTVSGSAGAANAATLAIETGTTSLFNVYGTQLRYTTADTTFSSATSDLSSAETTAASAASALTPSFFSGLSPYITATGASFTLDQTLTPSNSFSVQTTASNAPITVAAPITVSGSNSLLLNSSGALAIDAPITVSGAGNVVLDYNTSSPTNLTFALGSSINYGATNNGGTLNINGQAYTLLYKLTDSSNATGNGTDSGTDDIAGIDHAGDSGYYALATSVTGTGSASAAQFSHPLAGSGSNSFSGVFEGLGNTITNLTINDSSDYLVGLFGTIGHGTVRDLGLIGGSVTGTDFNYGNIYSSGGAVVGGLVGNNGNGTSGATSWVVNDYNTGTVTSTNSGDAGDLVGQNYGKNSNATIINSFATGTASAGGQADVGGLAGYNFGNNGTGLITQSYATGLVYSNGSYSNVGGLFGINNAYGGTTTVTDSYATGAVSVSSGTARPGGIVGYGGGNTSNLYWDTSTTGQSNASGAGGATATGYTTAQLQSNSTTGVTLTGFSGGAAGGQNGVYPYLSSFFPNGVQTVSGYAYNGVGNTPLASSATGAVQVSLNVGGVSEGSASTGANGYYYLALPASTLPTSPATAIAYATAPSSAQDGATLGTTSLSTATGTVAGPNVFGGYLNFATSATSYSTAISSFSSAQTSVNAVAGTGFSSSLSPYINATGASFTVDQSPGTNGLAVQTTASNAPITVAAPITVSGSNSLLLNSSGALAIDAPITVSGAGNVVLDYNTSSPTNLTFALGSSINYGATNNGGTLNINGQAYTLLYKLTDSSNATGNGTDSGTDDIAGIDHAGDSGYYALATSVTGTGSASAAQFSHPLAGSGSNSFSGVFEGLGNTITNLTINDSADEVVGLFGTIAHGTVRDLGLIGGSVSGSNTNYGNPYSFGGAVVGGLVGSNGNGTGGATSWVVNDYNTGTVNGNDGSYVGGLVGQNFGYNSNATIINSFATGAVSGGVNAWVGGLVGFNLGNGATGLITQAYATGAVTGGSAADVGGLLGANDPISSAIVSNAYSTGAVSVGSNGGSGGFVGYGDATGTTSNAYWDHSTSGLTNAAGVLGSNAVAYSSSQLQSTSTSGVTLTGFSGGAAGGQNGVYPYLTSFFPNGVQAISGYVYSGIGSTPLASGSSGAVQVSLNVGGVSEGSASTGANGYYYLALPASTLPTSSATAIAYATAPSSAQDGATLGTMSLSTATGTVAGQNIYGGYLNFATSATSYSTAISSFSSAQTAVNAVAGTGFSTGLAPYIDATGASFTVDQSPGTNGLAVQTTASNAPITVAAPITVSGSNSLLLNSSGALAIDAPITISGAGNVVLDYNTSSPTNLTFALGDSINYGATNNNGTLSINGQAYALLYKLTDSSNATGNGPDDGVDDVAGIDHTGGSGYYALATSLTGTGSASAAQFSLPLAGAGVAFNGVFEGLGNTITNLTINDSTTGNVALFGTNGGTVRDVGLIGGSIVASNPTLILAAGIAGVNSGSGALIVNDYNTGSVTATNVGTVGGLVGLNAAYAGTVSIMNSFATGAVSGAGASSVGGLVGNNLSYNNTNAPITNSFATGAVSGGGGAAVGGLVGGNLQNGGTASLTNVYATGVVSGGSGSYVGGIVGNSSGSMTNAYWDTLTSNSGQAAGAGTGGTGFSTTALQSNATTGLSLGSAFQGGAAGGQNGVYPYLESFYPNGVQALSGYAYIGVGTTPLASGSTGAVQVGLGVGGVLQAVSTTGANGYYYLALPAGTLTSTPASLVTYAIAPTSTLDGATLGSASLSTSTGTLAGPTIYGGYLNFATSATTYSSASTAFASAQNAVNAVAGAGFSSGLSPYIDATGASFTVDQSPGTNGLAVQTTASNAPITVAAPITVSGSNSLLLNSSGALAIDAPITVSGAGNVVLDYNTSSPTNLTFALGSSINYGATNNGGTLNINGQAYTLLYKLTDSSNATGNGTDSGTDDIAGIDHAGDSGYYALATSVTGTGSASAAQFSHPLAGSGSNSFSGVFEGLGNTITNLTINDSSDYLVGLFGTIGHGTVRDLGLIGGSVTGTDFNYGNIYSSGGAVVGGLVGNNGNGTSGATSWVVNDYNTGTVTSTNSGDAGDLVGQNYGKNSNATIINSFATGTASAGGQADVGGLAGYNFGNNGTGLITQSYATGLVYSNGSYSNVGGLFGINNAYGGTTTVTDSYATGAVSVSSGTARPGGIVGYGGGNTSNLYWDTSTTGQSNASGAGGATATGYTTAQLQSNSTTGVTLTGFSGGAAGGQNGVYPYLSSFFPNGVQTVSGIAYKDAGATPLASSAAGAGLVSLASGGAVLGTVTTGANGYYYLVEPTGTLAANQGVAAFTQTNNATGAQNALTFAQSSGGASALSMNVYGGWELDQPGSAITTLSGLNNAVGTAVGATPPSGFTLNNREIDATGAFTLDQSLNISGSLALSSAGTVGESGSSTITAGGLLLLGAGSYTLNGANQVAALAASTGSLSLVNTGDLTTASLSRATGTATAGAATSGTLSVVDTGDLTLAAGDPISGQSPVLSASGEFVNHAGSSAVTATSGRWLIYSSAPANDTFGSLNSANTPIFDATYSTLAPGSVTQSGNRYLFANQPVLTVTSTSDTKVYGVDDSTSLGSDYIVTGFPTGSGAFLTDTASTALSGTPSVTSTGSTAFAPVSGGPYPINIAPGSLTANNGYALSYVSSGSLAITPATITVSGATGVNKVYDTTTALPSGATGYTLSGIYSNDAGDLTVSAANAAYASPNAGLENINVSGLNLTGSAASNYQLSSTTVTGSGTISPATITVAGATGVNKTYDGTTALPAGATGYTVSGIYASDAAHVSVAAGNAAYAAATVGQENVNVSGLTLSGTAATNYVLSASNVTGTGTISASSTGSGNSGGSGSTGSSGGSTSGPISVSLPTAGGSSGYVLSGTSQSSTTGAETTVVGSLSNGIVTLTGTFIIHPRSGLGTASLPDEIAANGTEIVTFVPGTLTAQWIRPTATALASTTAAASANLDGDAFDLMPLVFPSLDDPTRPWDAINAFGDPGYDQTVLCLGRQCAVVPRGAGSRFMPTVVVR